MTRWLSLLAFFAASGFALWRAPLPDRPGFVVARASGMSALPVELEHERLPSVAPLSHAASLTELADGRLALAWYAGKHEAAADVKIWFSVRDPSGWSTPRVVATREDTAAAAGAHVKALGNPVLHGIGKRLHLWYVAVSVGGWSGSWIGYKFSDDGGITWSAAERLATSPFFNLGTLVRSSPVALADGGLGLPIYQELFSQRAEWLRLAHDGRILGKSRLPSPTSAIQPAAAAIGGQDGLALLRTADKRYYATMVSVTHDAGATWEPSPTLPIENHNTSLALLRLRSGELLLAANPQRGRHVLQLFKSGDNGRNWQPGRIIERDSNELAEYSYPSLLQGTDGRIHLAYTFQFNAIAHVSFTEAAIDGGRP